MKVGFVMDPLASVDIDADTTFALMLAAQQRGHELYFMQMKDLAAEGDECWATMQRADVRRREGDHYSLGAATYERLHELDCVLMRKDPPFDVEYLHAAHLLELAEEKGCLVVNKPNGLRAANEKLYALHFSEFMPDTLVTRSRQRIREFLDTHDDRCIIKPVDGHGGEGIFMLEKQDRNLNALLEVATDHGRRRIICQEYMEAAREGDKRILLLDGKPLGGILRVPSSDEHRGNIHVGGTVEKAELTDADLAICEGIGPRLSRDGLWFVGIDVIGGTLTEVNVTSPTGIQEMSRLDDEDYAGRTIKWVEQFSG